MGIPGSKKRIYHFLLDHRLGGPHVFVKSIADCLGKSDRYEFVIATTGRGAMTQLSLVNLRHFWFPLYVFEIAINSALISWYGVSGKIQRRDALFHVHGAANIAPVIAGFLLRTPVIWHFHDVIPKFRALVNVGRLFVDRVKHRLATVTEESLLVYGIPEAALIPPPVDLDYWKDGEPRTRTRGPMKLLNTANLNTLKGQDVLLEALGQLDFEWELRLIGAPLTTHAKYGRSLTQSAEALERAKPGRRVVFMGWQERDRIRDCLRDCDVFVLPSRSEACPIALLEAMAVGKVCVASNVGGIHRIIAQPSLGFVVPPDDPGALAEALRTVGAMSPQAAIEMGARAREHIRNGYSLSSVSEQVAKLYEDLLGG